MNKNGFPEKLAKSIFKKSFIILSQREKSFVQYQEQYYKRFTARIREQVFPVIGREKLKTREYELIQDWFFRTIPLFCVLNGIKKCVENASSQAHAVYSLAFFKPFVQAEYRRFVRQMTGSRYFSDPWGYDEWKNDQKTKKNRP